MKILFVTSTPIEYSSSGNMRNVALINGLIKLGHEVQLLTSEADKNNILYDESLLSSKITKRYYIPLGNIHKKFSYSEYQNKAILTVKKYIYKTLSGLSLYDPRKGLVNQLDRVKIDEKFELIISSSDPKSSHLIAEKLIDSHKNISNKWVQYWGDPFSNDINKQSKLPSFFIKKEEKRLIGLSDFVVYVSPFTLEEQISKFKIYKEKMFFIPVPYITPIEYDETKNSKFVLGYFGDYYSKDRDILPLYNSACKLHQSIDLIVYGNSDVDLKSNKTITINVREKASSIKKVESKCDLLVCILNKKGTQIPGKIYHYAATNKPILIIVDGDYKERMKEYLLKYDRYYVCNNDENSIVNAVNEINASYRKIKYKPSKYFNSTEIASKFIDLFNKTISFTK